MFSLKNIPMAMTWMRVVLIPVFLFAYYAPLYSSLTVDEARSWAGLAFMIATITDGLDRYLTRKLGVSS